MVESDHKPLETIFKKSLIAVPKRLQRMMLRLQQFNITVQYKKGSEMHIADCLSRAPIEDRHLCEICEEVTSINAADYVYLTRTTWEQIRDRSRQDNSLQKLKETVMKGWPSEKVNAQPEVKEYWNYCDEIAVQDGVLYKGDRVIVPTTMRSTMLEKIHYAHQGVEACLRPAQEAIFWPGMTAAIQDRVTNCTICNEFRTAQTSQPLLTHSIPNRPCSKVGADLCTFESLNFLLILDYYLDYWRWTDYPA